MNKRFQRVFLDYASTTPVDKRVFNKMKPFFDLNFGNPSAVYNEGLIANEALLGSRNTIARICGVKNHEVIFTSSGTEANNLIILGSINGRKISKKERPKEIMISEIEHPSLIEPAKIIQNEKLAKVHILEVKEDGIINLEQFSKKLNKNIFLISVILANNEIGVINPLREIGSIVKKFKNKLGRSFDEPPFIHTDASQAPNFMDISLDRLSVHAMTIDASKIYGPKGAGCLIKKSYVPISPLMYGGGQEFNLRPGTENVANIVGLAEALRISQLEKDKFSARMLKLQNHFLSSIKNKFPSAIINGSLKNRLPNNVNVCFKNLNSEFAVIQLDEKGLSCSATTSCKGLSDDVSSYVVKALHKKDQVDCSKSSLRFTMGRKTTKKEIDFAIKVLFDII